jgi:hypothetical protein
VKGDWRKPHNISFNMYCSVDLIKKHEMGRACGTYGEEQTYRVLVDKPKGKGPFCIPKRT